MVQKSKYLLSGKFLEGKIEKNLEVILKGLEELRISIWKMACGDNSLFY